MPYLLPPNEQHVEVIKKLYYYKDPKDIEEDVDALIEWLAKQPHLPHITDRTWLKHFLIGRKNNLQRTKTCLESYFIVRAEMPEFFDDMTSDAEWVKKSIKVGQVSVLPKLTPEANRLYVIRSIENPDGEFNALAMCKATLKIIDHLMRREPIYGFVFLLDLKHCQMSYLLNFTPTITKNLMRCIDDATPLRVAGIHYVNPPSYISRLVNFFKMFMPTKLQNRIMVHDTYESLHKHFPKDMLPNEYGGTAGDIEKFEEETMKQVAEDDEWHKNLQKADLSKRPVQPKKIEMDTGTFKKLTID